MAGKTNTIQTLFQCPFSNDLTVKKPLNYFSKNVEHYFFLFFNLRIFKFTSKNFVTQLQKFNFFAKYLKQVVYPKFFQQDEYFLMLLFPPNFKL